MAVRRFICGRKRQTLFLLAAIIVIYCLLQLFSLSRLFEQQNIKLISKDELFVEDMLLDAERNKMIVKPGLNNQSANQYDLSLVQHLPFGVHKMDAMRYSPDKDGHFVCLKSKEKIPYAFVNDDYCDCSDGTDEPGTSACPTSRFFCRYQLAAEEAQFISSSRVNDGICDCCDGSDEWQGALVPANIQIKDKREKRPVIHAPCENVCKEVEETQEKYYSIHTEGVKLKAAYIEAAKNITNKEMYGPDGAYFKLSQRCFTYHDGDYEYKVCPFVSVTQQKFPHPSIFLGRDAHWELAGYAGGVLMMKNGDSHVCPGTTSRSVKISFYCGLDDIILKITEDERCLYRVKFSTPAAC